MLLVMLAGWINRHQQDMIEYLKTENAILKEKLGKKRIILNDQQRRTLAVLAKKISRNALSEICNVFSPETILKWHRELIAKKYDGSKCRKYGRPQISDELRKLIIKLARQNRSWGYPRIEGQLKYLGFKVSHSTIANILKKEGLEPQPSRTKKTTWAEFIKVHWKSLSAIDFFHSATCKVVLNDCKAFKKLIIDFTCCSASSSLPERAIGVIRWCEASGTT